MMPAGKGRQAGPGRLLAHRRGARRAAALGASAVAVFTAMTAAPAASYGRAPAASYGRAPTAGGLPVLSGVHEVLPVSRSGNGRGHRRPSVRGVSLTRSTTMPYWACPEGVCEAIIDPRPVKRGSRLALPMAAAPTLEGSGEQGGLDPSDLRSAYSIPTSGGEAQTIALIEAYGYAAAESDLARYRERYGLEPCTKANGCFHKVNEAGEEANYPSEGGTLAEGWQLESALDLDMASAACPHCRLLLVEASSQEPAATAEAVNTAAGLGATEISNSYSYPEEDFEWCVFSHCEQYSADYDHPGVVITASAGDYGYDDGGNAPGFPATAPYVVSVGGTRLTRTPDPRGWSERVWGEPERGLGTGSGCSLSEPKPWWQTDTGCAHRTDNDVAAVAACESPVSAYISADEGWVLLCGTSVSSPLVAGIMAHADAYVRSLPGAEAFYSDPAGMFDVPLGTNAYRRVECTPPMTDAYLCHGEDGYSGPAGNGTLDGPLAVEGKPPSTVTRPASDVTGTIATLDGTVDPQGSATTYRFEYGTSRSYGTSVPVAGASAGSAITADQVSQSLTGLRPDTVYHYRLVASSSAGASEGEDGTFTTASPSVDAVTPDEEPMGGAGVVTISGANFSGATAVDFGSTPAASFQVESGSSILAVSPPGRGTVDVSVTTPAGTTTAGPSDQFTYVLGDELGGAEEGSGSDDFGQSAALSADGNTALIGGGNDYAAWVFTRSGSGWIQQGKKLTVPDPGGWFGEAVALSADGDTAIVGAPEEHGGAAWVFTRSGSTWTEQAELTTGADKFGFTVALSADGNTAIVGAPRSEGGAAWVFTRSGSTWTQGVKLTCLLAGELKQACGDSVTISGDGNTALVGAGPEVGGEGAWVFTRSGSTWTQQAELHIGSGALGYSDFGDPVALSADGETAMIGDQEDNGDVGAAWAFARTGSTWTQMGGKITGAETKGKSSFGFHIALSADGDTALIGGPSDGGGGAEGGWPGAVWRFQYVNGAWVQRGKKITEPVQGFAPGFGTGVALSADGYTGLGGAPGNEQVGAVWVLEFPAPLSVARVAPDHGPASGGTDVTIAGENLLHASAVHFGTAAASEVKIRSATEVTAVAPPGSGAADITVTTPEGTSPTDSADVFTYSQAPAVSTGEASPVGQRSATLNATVNPEGAGVSECRFEYGPTPEYGSSVPCAREPGAGSGPVAVSAALSGLSPASAYYYRVLASDEDGTSYGSQQELTTLEAKPPAVVTSPASSVLQAAATLNATVNPEGAGVEDCHFEYGPTPAYGSSVPCAQEPGAGSSPVAVSAALSGLSPGSAYYYRVLAGNEDGTSYGSQQTLTTLEAKPPTVLTGPLSEIKATTAVLKATVNPEGANVEECRFEYGATPAYGSSTECLQALGDATSPVAVSGYAAGLSYGATYYYRIVASNAGGTGYGSQQTFEMTQRPTVLTESASSIAQTSAEVNGFVDPEGAKLTGCAFEYGTTPAYGSVESCTGGSGEPFGQRHVGTRLVDLSPGTTYYYRLSATNEDGTSYGEGEAFTTTTPELPEVGKCVLGEGSSRYKNSTCTKPGEGKGRYAWLPWPDLFENFSLAQAAATFETIHKTVIKCAETALDGAYTNSQTASVSIDFSGCELQGSPGVECESEDAGAGTIETQPLEGQLGLIAAKKHKVSVGWELKPAVSGYLTTFKCGAATISIGGSVIASIPTVNTMSTQFTLTLQASQGKQIPEMFEGGHKDTLSFLSDGTEEQAGLSLSGRIVNEVRHEIKATA